MRTRIYAGLVILLLIVAATGVYLRATRETRPADLGIQALVPSYGITRCRPAETITLLSSLLDTTAAGLFGSTDNITGVRLWGPDGQAEVLDWSVHIYLSEEQVGEPVAYLRPLTISLRAPDRALTLTDIEFAFANGMRKAFKFGELRLVPRDDTPVDEMWSRLGVLWEVQDCQVCSGSPSSGERRLAVVSAISVGRLDRAPEDCSVTSIDLGNPLYRVVDSSACVVRDAAAVEQALKSDGGIDDACATRDRGLPLPLTFTDFQPETTNWVNVAFLVEATGPEPSLVGRIYAHPRLTLDIAGLVIHVTPPTPVMIGGNVNPYSPEAADFLKEWGK